MDNSMKGRQWLLLTRCSTPTSEKSLPVPVPMPELEAFIAKTYAECVSQRIKAGMKARKSKTTRKTKGNGDRPLVTREGPWLIHNTYLPVLPKRPKGELEQPVVTEESTVPSHAQADDPVASSDPTDGPGRGGPTGSGDGAPDHAACQAKAYCRWLSWRTTR